MNTMSRRQFLRTGAAAVVCAPLLVSEIAKGQPQDIATFDPELTYGHISANDRPYCQWKVLLDGEDISDQCTEAHDREGWVMIFDTNRYGDLSIWHPRKLYGKVRILPWD